MTALARSALLSIARTATVATRATLPRTSSPNNQIGAHERVPTLTGALFGVRHPALPVRTPLLLSTARAAISLSGGGDSDVATVQRMPAPAIDSRRVLGRACFSAQNVDPVRHGVQMAGIEAGRIATQVVEVQPIGNIPNQHRVHESVDQPHTPLAPADVHARVSKSVAIAGELPALVVSTPVPRDDRGYDIGSGSWCSMRAGHTMKYNGHVALGGGYFVVLA